MLAGLAAAGMAGCTTMAVDARTIAATQWRVAAINGHATPAGGPFELGFNAGVISARFGCNSGGGGYRLEGGVIRPTGPMLATQMACASATDEPQIDPMTFERWGFAILGKPMRMRWVSGRHLILSNDAGSLDLQRKP